MKSLAAWKSILICGTIGAAGGLLAWPAGEAVRALATPSSVPAPAAGASPPHADAPGAAGEAPAGPAPSPEFAARLARVGAKSGDVQISLIWDNANDLDLHCVDPGGREVSTATRGTPAPDGGAMDVDANTGCFAPDPAPVENAHWPRGTAPLGVYRVFVSVYDRCPGAPDATPFRVSILHDGKRHEVDGTVTFSERRGKQLVHEFEVRTKTEAPTGPRSPSDPVAPVPAPTERALPAAGASAAWALVVAVAVTLGCLVGHNRYRKLRPRLPMNPHIARAAGLAVLVVGGTAFLVTRGSGNGWDRLGGLVLSGCLAGVLLGSAIAPGTPAAAKATPGPARVPSPPGPPPQPRPVAPPPVAPKPLAPPVARPPSPPPVAPKPAAPPAAKPAVSPPAPKPAAPLAKPPVDPDACPYCRNGTRHPGPRGGRYCVVHDQTY